MRRCALAVCVALALAGCGTSIRPPADGAARVVPADALAYVHVSLDSSRSAVELATRTGAQLPGYAHLVTAVRRRLSAVSGTSFSAAIRPWLGDEAAVALVPDGSSAGELIVLAVARTAAARSFLHRQRAPAARLLGHFLVLGTPAAVAASAAVAHGHAPALATATDFRRLAAAEPADRVLDGYLSAAGVSELLDGGSSELAALGGLLGDARAVAAAVAPTPTGGRIWVRILAPVNPQSPAPPHTFTPTLPDVLPAATTLLVDTPHLARAAPGLLSLLPESGVLKGVVGVIGALGAALKSQAGPDLGSLFTGEGGIFVLDGSLGVIAHTSSPSRARLELADSVPVLTQLFAPDGSSGVEPEVATREENGVEVTQLTLGASLTLSYAVVRDDVVIATGTRAVAQVAAGQAPLSGSRAYRSVLARTHLSSGPVVFMSLSRIDRLPSLSKLLVAAGLATLEPAFDHITALGLHSTGGRPLTTAELYFTIP